MSGKENVYVIEGCLYGAQMCFRETAYSEKHIIYSEKCRRDFLRAGRVSGKPEEDQNKTGMGKI